ncbi:MAG: hypothetical protein HKN73_20630, partial [Gemmatimonadetes bacterium]|nr:hypothetical protein [Gemmatimonadota bacterium]
MAHGGTRLPKKQYHPPMTDPERILRDLVEGRTAVPFDALGNHPGGAESSPGRVVRAFLPWAEEAWVARPEGRTAMEARGRGVFVAHFPGEKAGFPYRLQARGKDRGTGGAMGGGGGAAGGAASGGSAPVGGRGGAASRGGGAVEPGTSIVEFEDPYRFPPVLDEEALA